MHREASAASLGLLRVWVFGIWLVYLIADPIQLFSGIPVGVFDPHGPLRLIPLDWLPIILSEGGLWALRAIAMFLVATVTIGLVPRKWVSVLAVAVLVYYQGVLRGYGGHMNHAEFLLLYAAGVIAIFPCFDALSAKEPPRGDHSRLLYAAPFTVIMATIAVTYSFVGAARLATGPDIFTSGTMTNLILSHHLSLPEIGPAAVSDLPLITQMLAPGILGAIYLGATVLELLTPLALFDRIARVVIVTFILIFHVFTWAWLGVPFLENMLLLVVFSEKTFHRLATRLNGSLTSVSLPSLSASNQRRTSG